MRVHIRIDDELVHRLDELVGVRDRSGFIENAVRKALDDRIRDEALEMAMGSISDSGHEWDADAAQWVRAQRAEPVAR